jgi:hypothetical protein
MIALSSGQIVIVATFVFAVVFGVLAGRDISKRSKAYVRPTPRAVASAPSRTLSGPNSLNLEFPEKGTTVASENAGSQTSPTVEYSLKNRETQQPVIA